MSPDECGGWCSLTERRVIVYVYNINIIHTSCYYINYTSTSMTLITNSTQGKLNHFSNNFPNLGVPKPVTGSHPDVALKPDEPQPELFPATISLNASEKSGE